MCCVQITWWDKSYNRILIAKREVRNSIVIINNRDSWRSDLLVLGPTIFFVLFHFLCSNLSSCLLFPCAHVDQFCQKVFFSKVINSMCFFCVCYPERGAQLSLLNWKITLREYRKVGKALSEVFQVKKFVSTHKCFLNRRTINKWYLVFFMLF